MIRAADIYECTAIAQKMGYDPSSQCKGIIFDDLRAACLYDHWTPNSVNVHIYSNSPRDLMSPDFIQAIFSYPFEQAGLGLLIAITPADNTPSLTFSRALGFKDVCRLRDGWKIGVDLVVREMKKEHCRWLMRKVA